MTESSFQRPRLNRSEMAVNKESRTINGLAMPNHPARGVPTILNQDGFEKTRIESASFQECANAEELVTLCQDSYAHHLQTLKRIFGKQDDTLPENEDTLLELMKGNMQASDAALFNALSRVLYPKGLLDKKEGATFLALLSSTDEA